MDMENPIKMDDLGVPGTTIFGTPQKNLFSSLIVNIPWCSKYPRRLGV